MKNNIRKIIREEQDDFDWIRHVKVLDLDKPWAIINDSDDVYGIDIQIWLLEKGWIWNSGRNSVLHHPVETFTATGRSFQGRRFQSKRKPIGVDDSRYFNTINWSELKDQ